jgi:hypothetical protein
MAGPLLRSGNLREFHPLGAVGNPVYSAASQLRAAMRRQLGQEVADLFAIPRQNEQGDTIDWYAPYDGDVVPWSAATTEERTAAKDALLAARQRIAERSRTLQADEHSERQVFGKLLAQATEIPGDDHVYLVDGTPVITFWGFHPLDAPAGFDVIGGLDVQGGAPAVSAAAAPDPAPPPIPPVGPAPVIPPPPEERRRAWWWWLLLPLLLLLLLLLLLFGLRSCGVDLPWLPSLPLIGPDRPAVVEPAPPVPVGPDGRPVADPDRAVDYYRQRGLVVDRDRDVVIDPTTGRMVGPFDPTAGQPDTATPPAEPERPGETPTTEPPRSETGVPPATPPGEQPPEEQPPEEQPPPGEQAPTPVEPTPVEPTPIDPPGVAPVAPGPQGPGAPPPGVPETPLTIPDRAVRDGSTEFLKGQWRSITGLQDRDGNPVTLNYRFQNGQGTVGLDRAVGGRRETCTGQARSTMRDGTLVIGQKGIRCPDGTTFQDSDVECRVGAGGQAECRGVNTDGTGYDVRIVK